MRIGSIGAALTALAIAFAGIACSKAMPPMQPLGELQEPDAEFSPVRYWDRDLVSLNERCPNTHAPLNPAIEPVYVNGRPIGFC